MFQKKMIGAVLGAFALSAAVPVVARAADDADKPAPKAEKKGKKAKKGTADKKAGEKSCSGAKGGEKSCGGDTKAK